MTSKSTFHCYRSAICVQKITSSNRHIFTFAKHSSSSSSSSFLQTYSILHACKLIYYSWKKAGKLFASMMIRSILLLYASEYVLFTHCMSHYLLCACSCSCLCLCLYLSEMPTHRLVKHTHLVNRYHAVSFSRRHSADKCKINKQIYLQ